MVKVDVKCPFYEQPVSVKHGPGKAKLQRYRCQSCCRTFQPDYAYRACQPGMKEQIVDLAMNNSDIRDTAQALHISINTVVRTFKKLAPRYVTKLPLDYLQIQLICEVNEMWSFISNKKQQRWLWQAWEPRLKRIIAHSFGSRGKKTLRKLLGLLSDFSIAYWCTDNFSVFELWPGKKLIAGKLYTQQIERENLNLRNQSKRLNHKTLGYSKSAEMHDKIIGTFIEREHYLQ
ncbi:IS1 family transposase [Salmonella enterica]|nr:IS1 family transposase [Salmonella enterica subsp. enterica]EAW9674679.1 IS1 family transposase [Salmonella enterica]EDW0630125.1 IS1 family transposase [Salmonella enterica subsp. enterica serovar Anatum]EAY5853378.1 IS1 family transposase [Salmonella enterica]EBA2166929.1 IS1 family transposase [Salmonella enterica]